MDLKDRDRDSAAEATADEGLQASAKAADGPHLPRGTPPYIVTEQVGHLMRRAYQRHLAIFQSHAEDLNLTSVQFVTLCVLRDIGACAQKDLVEATAVDQATIRGIIERLQARGLIEVTRDDDDRRKVIVSLLPAGAALVEAMVPRGHLISERTMAPLNPAERVALLFLLRKLAL